MAAIERETVVSGVLLEDNKPIATTRRWLKLNREAASSSTEDSSVNTLCPKTSVSADFTLGRQSVVEGTRSQDLFCV